MGENDLGETIIVTIKYFNKENYPIVLNRRIAPAVEEY